MIKTIFLNLISNAIKFVDRGGKIEIHAHTEVEFIQVTIKDNGIGIPEEKIPTLFSIEENNSTLGTANEKGSGLGLILCKEFIEKHQGKIWAESQQGKGSQFIFTLPVYTAQN